MKASYMQRGEALDYRNTGNTTISAGTVLAIGKRLGIAAGDIAPGELGVVEVEGVYLLPVKTPGAVEQGAELYWGEDGIVTTSEGETVRAGFAAEPASESDSSVVVKINA